MSDSAESLGLCLWIEYVSADTAVAIAGNSNLKPSEEFFVYQDECVIGREGSRTRVHIHDVTSQISRRHVRIYWENGHYYLKDLDSVNKTYIQYDPIYTPAELRDEKKTEILVEPGKPRVLSKGKFRLSNVIQFGFIDTDSTRPMEEGLTREDLTLIPYKRQLKIKDVDAPIPLAPREYAFLHILMENIEPVSYDDIIIRVWGLDQAGFISNEAVNDLKGRINQRLKEHHIKYTYIQTRRGIGYIFEKRSSDADTQSVASE